MKRSILTSLLVLNAILFCHASGPSHRHSEKMRTVITTDGEVDDMNSFIRMLLYSDKLQIEGLIYSSSMWHYAGDGKGTLFTSEMPMTEKMYGQRSSLRWTGTTWMEELIAKYALVYPSLRKNDRNYPDPDYLKKIIRIGNIDFEGEMSKDTKGSDLIKLILLDDKPGPVYLQAWGGTNTIARALKSIEDQYCKTKKWKEIYDKVSSKAVIYIILDQDATYRKYVSVNWPGIKVIYNSLQFSCLAYNWYRDVPVELQKYLDGNWFAENIKFNHGPLLETYYLWGDGQKVPGDPEQTQGDPDEAQKHGRKQYDFLSEGDSPAWLFLVDFGLGSSENPSFGGPGGRFKKSDSNHGLWKDGTNVADSDLYTGRVELLYPQARWIRDLQNDFASRAKWCVNDYNRSNHPPVVKLDGKRNISAKPGETVKLKGVAYDPDGNKVKFHWWQYREAGTCNKDIQITGAWNKDSSFIVPRDAKKGETIHIILEVSDDGSPVLTRYQRAVVTVD